MQTLEKVHDVYIGTKEMVQGRQLILIALTAFVWIFESMFIYLMAGYMNMEVAFMTVTNYISDSFFGINNIIFNNYIYICTAIFLVMTVVIYFKRYVLRKKVK